MSMRFFKRQTLAVFSAVLGVVLLHTGINRCLAAEPDGSGLTPALAMAADGTPVYPGAVLPTTKIISVAFRLKPNESGKVLHSQWIALDEGNQPVAENHLDLNGQKAGWLRLMLKEPAPPGKYRLETKLDDAKWQSVDLTIAPPITQGAAEKPTDLIPLKEGSSLTYDMLVVPSAGTTINVPGAKAGADGTIRGTMTVSIGKKEEAGTVYQATVNGTPAADLRVRVEDKGLLLVRQKPVGEGAGEAKDVNPPDLMQPLPAKLEHGLEWTIKSSSGGEQKLQFFGPVMLNGPTGQAPGYIVFGEEQLALGAPGTSAARGRETIERYYIPKVGLIKETRVSVIGGKVASRMELAMPSGLPYKLVANPEMRGRLGKVQFTYPPDTKVTDTKVAIHAANAKPSDKPAQSGYGAESYDLLPGKYEASINGKRVPIEVKSAHVTTPNVGVIRISASKDTQFRILDTDKKAALHTAYGSEDVALPVGNYFVEIGGGSEAISVTDGKVTEF